MRIDQDKFDTMILELLDDCHSLTECNCDNCMQQCVLYYNLKKQNIENIPEILNILRVMFLIEYSARVGAIRSAPRYSELKPKEYYSILSNKNHYFLTEYDELYAIY